MTVKELIAELQKHDEDSQVVYWYKDAFLASVDHIYARHKGKYRDVNGQEVDITMKDQVVELE
jgi:hypothetical protein